MASIAPELLGHPRARRGSDSGRHHRAAHHSRANSEGACCRAARARASAWPSPAAAETSDPGWLKVAILRSGWTKATFSSAADELAGQVGLELVHGNPLLRHGVPLPNGHRVVVQ